MIPETFGPYQVRDLVGRGGMGEVHRAYDTHRQRVVALKRLRPEFVADERFGARFLQECQRAARLTEPHVIPIHDFGDVDGRLYLDMRMIEGPNLAQVLAAEGPLSPGQAVEIVTQVASALDAAHAAGLVHRDVKPSNVLLAARRSALHCYLADFGVAGAIGASTSGVSLTASCALMGTLDYIAPERLRGRPADHRVDVYSLACLLHEAVTGEPPFRCTELSAMIHAHLNLEPPRASELVASVPAALDAVISRGMAKDPSARYASAGELAAAAAALYRDGNPVPLNAPSGETAHVDRDIVPVRDAATTVPVPRNVPMQGEGAAPKRRRRRWVLPVLTVTLMFIFATSAAVTSLWAAQPVHRETVDANGAGPPFMPPNGSPGEPQASAPALEDVAITGDMPGLYGGIRSDACNAQAIRTYLEANPAKAAAWASAQDLEQPADIKHFLEGLTPLTLRTDTAVTNHGFENGRPTPFQSVLQSGTAVLVDAEGLPRVRCYCGNPLREPEQRTWTRYVGSEWDGFSSESVAVIAKARAEVQEFTVVEPSTNEAVNRPRATSGEKDRPADPAVAEKIKTVPIGGAGKPDEPNGARPGGPAGRGSDIGAEPDSSNPGSNPGPANPGPANPGPANPGPANPGPANPGLGRATNRDLATQQGDTERGDIEQGDDTRHERGSSHSGRSDTGGSSDSSGPDSSGSDSSGSGGSDSSGSGGSDSSGSGGSDSGGSSDSGG